MLLIPMPTESAPPTADAALTVDRLSVSFTTREGELRAVRDVSFSLGRGRSLGLVGESGSGKSVTAHAVLRLLPKSARASGSVYLGARGRNQQIDILSLPVRSAALRAVRGGEIAMIFQEPMKAFSPVHTIGNQVVEAVRMHHRVSRRQAVSIAVENLRRVGIPEPTSRLKSYPHELSGGLRQRAMIAMALSSGASVLIADEPTTALDVTIQAQVLDVLRSLREESGISLLLITHDLGVVAENCDDVAVMYLGSIVEAGPVDTVFREPRHPYTRALMQAMPDPTRTLPRLAVIEGSVPVPIGLPPGCGFAPRCPFAKPGRCDVDDIAWQSFGDGSGARCVRLDEIEENA